MNGSDDKDTQETAAASEDANPQPDRATTSSQQRREARRWWIKLVLQPVLFLATGVLLIVGLGVAQRLGFISAKGGSGSATALGDANLRYICPMMCTPPQSEPGRCPVCAMELVRTTSSSQSNTDSGSIQVDSAARRVANIGTVAVQSERVSRKIRAVGQLGYDETSLKTISAYVDGRLDRLDADFTGLVVEKDDSLALLYSPALYTGQVELLTTKRSLANLSPSSEDARQSQRRLVASTRRRLIELGMTERQVAELEEQNEASRRLELLAPISGTVIEKLAVEGQYVKMGQPIYRLADLSNVWLMLELFPEDAAAIRAGQHVEAEVQSLPGRKFAGHVGFVDPHVDPKTRTVGVRVVVPNPDGLLRVGDYAKAAIDVPLGESGDQLVVPRSAVLMAGDHSVVFVETQPGRFELRQVVLGASTGEQIVIHEGLRKGEQVASRGNFLIDSQMQLGGNPSLIDPTKAKPIVDIDFEPLDLPPIGPMELANPAGGGSQSPSASKHDEAKPAARTSSAARREATR